MARIELRHATIRFKDGLSGTAAVGVGGIAAGAATLPLSTVVLNSSVTDQVPVGARLTIDGNTTVHTVTARTPGTGTTTSVTISPAVPNGEDALAAAAVVFLPQQIEIKIGDGNLTYSEANEYEYELDRGALDSVREGDEQPMEVNIDFVYEFITTGTSESVTPMDALKRKGGAAEWVSASADLCEPYCIDIEVEHVPPCGTSQKEITLFPEFRSESREVDLGEASISVSGRCNATEPTVTRET